MHWFIGTEACQAVPVVIGNTPALLIDTPGFDDTKRSDSEILSEIASVLTIQYESGMKLKGIIYMHRITDIRYGSSAVKTFDICRHLCGDEALKNVLLVTARWSDVQESVGASRECDLRDNFWSFMLGRGSNMSRFHDDRDSAIGLVSQLLVKEDCVLGLQREISEEGKSLDETSAGAYVTENVEKLKATHEQELESLKRLGEELRQDELEMRRILERDLKAEKAKLQELQQQKAMLRYNVADDVHSQINTRSRLDRASKGLLPLLPSVISLIGVFAGMC